MDKTLRLDIVTPDRVVVSETVDYVGVRGLEGDFGVLPGHASLLTALSVGVLHYSAQGGRKSVFISGGFAEVDRDKVTILAESAETAESIDLARAEAAKRRAEERLAAKDASLDMERAHISLQRAMTRINILSGR